MRNLLVKVLVSLALVCGRIVGSLWYACYLIGDVFSDIFHGRKLDPLGYSQCLIAGFAYFWQKDFKLTVLEDTLDLMAERDVR